MNSILMRPGILNWAIEGWKRLRKRERFYQPDSVGSVLEDMEHLASPVLAFVQECCEVVPGRRCFVNDIYDAYCLWSAWDGVRKNPTKQTFGRNLQAAVPGIAVKRNHKDGRFYEGIDLTAEYRALLQEKGPDNALTDRDKGLTALNRDQKTSESDPWEDTGYGR